MTAETDESFYGKPLAEIHGRHYENWLEAAFPWLLDICAGPLAKQDSLLVDLGCGQGRWLARVHESGQHCIGLDRSRAFANAVADQALAVVVGDAAAPPFAKADVLTAFGEVLSYLDEADDPAKPQATLANLTEILQPGGLLLADVMVREGLEVLSGTREREGRDDAGKPWRLRSTVHLSADHRLLTREIDLETAQGRVLERHFQGLIDVEAAIRHLERRGVVVEVHDRWGPVRLMPGRKAFVIRRPPKP